ncbi:MAG: YigZ family protein [Clostridia bacterium]|nr:YigZ family protein [Clostridia bacterium]
MQSFKTVEKPTESEMIIERSRFITLIAPAPTESVARGILSDRKKQHYQATHNCYAYMTDNGLITKCSDDGEPSGTAGAPILSAINAAGLSGVIVVVTRYFGGIKLGAGGLTRAYLRCATEAIKKADVKTLYLAEVLKTDLSYDEYKAFSRFKSQGFKVISTEYSDRVYMTLAVKSGAIGRFSNDFIDFYKGKVAFERVKSEYIGFDEE